MSLIDINFVSYAQDGEGTFTQVFRYTPDPSHNEQVLECGLMGHEAKDGVKLKLYKFGKVGGSSADEDEEGKHCLAM